MPTIVGYGFGYSERRLSTGSGKRVAAYLSSYFVTGKKRKATLQESVMAGDMPRSIVHVSVELTQRTGVTMRELRFRRFVWFLADRTSCSLREAREIANQLVAGTLDLTARFAPSPRMLAQVLGRNHPRADWSLEWLRRRRTVRASSRRGRSTHVDSSLQPIPRASAGTSGSVLPTRFLPPSGPRLLS